MWLESQYFGEYSDIKLVRTTSEKEDNPSDAANNSKNEKSGESGDKKSDSSEAGKDTKDSASNKTGSDDTPDTGDGNNMSAYIVAAGFSAAVIVIMAIYWKKMKSE